MVKIIDGYMLSTSNFTINITVCDENYYYASDEEEKEQYVYELDDDFLWRLR